MSDSFYDQLFSVRDKVALVTGGTRGIGLMIAEALLRGGARVYISSRKADACQEAESALSEFGDCSAYPCDISSMEGCQELAAEIARREPKLDILVNNAGLTWTASLEDLDEKGWDRVVDLDMKTPFFLLQQLLPKLRAAASATPTVLPRGGPLGAPIDEPTVSASHESAKITQPMLAPASRCPLAS